MPYIYDKLIQDIEKILDRIEKKIPQTKDLLERNNLIEASRHIRYAITDIKSIYVD